MQEPPGANVVFIRSLFYGIGAGAGFGILVGLIASRSIFSLPVTALLGGSIGGSAGLVLGLYLITTRSKVSWSVRLFASLLTIITAYLGLSIWLRDFPSEPSVMVLVVPPGALAWVLLPLVLRPEERHPITWSNRNPG